MNRLIDTKSAGVAVWITLYVCSVLALHAILGIVLILTWKVAAPLAVWDFVIGILSSAVVALLAGVVTILISWATTQRFGQETVDDIAAHVKNSLATTLSSKSQLRDALRILLSQANDKRDSLIIFGDPEILFESEILAQLISERVSLDLPSLLVWDLPSWILNPSVDCNQPRPSELSTIWRCLAKAIDNDDEEKRRFTKRRCLLLPFPTQGEMFAIRMLHSDDNMRSGDLHAIWAPAAMHGSEDTLGIQTSIDRHASETLLRRLLLRLQEPACIYSPDLISPEDITQGVFTGMPTTRAIITSQILTIIRAASKFLAEDSDSTRSITAQFQEGPRPFIYSGELFSPPKNAGDGDHSGSFLESLFTSGKVAIGDRKVWEVAAGPGYVTSVLARLCPNDQQILATDLSQRAISIATENVKKTGQASKVQFVACDCLEWTFRTSSDNRLSMSYDGSEIVVDDVIVDLPLLPYFGNRNLSPPELPYLEKSDHETVCFPPTMRKLIFRLAATMQGTAIRLLVPACASNEKELEKVCNELTSLCPNCRVEEVVFTGSGFLHLLQVTAEQSQTLP